mmetsp:Transcript_8759/g.53858  ORF Transcript_8759/g.53858 Transcript_8759/m.53858 type:complete len:84 (+) Transcript_8759:692-943(+)
MLTAAWFSSDGVPCISVGRSSELFNARWPRPSREAQGMSQPQKRMEGLCQTCLWIHKKTLVAGRSVSSKVYCNVSKNYPPIVS